MEGGYERNIVISLRSTKIRKHQDGYGVLVGETRGNTFAKTLLFTEFNVIKTNKIELMYLLFLCLILLERQLIMGTKNEGKIKHFLVLEYCYLQTQSTNVAPSETVDCLVLLLGGCEKIFAVILSNQ